VRRGRDELPSIVGTPVAGESAGGTTFDGGAEAATFPGDLPDDPATLFDDGSTFRGLSSTGLDNADYRFLRFRPPALERSPGAEPALPHIRLDRALQFLIGDKLE
jgi:predicted YcjX-like family ATPase